MSETAQKERIRFGNWLPSTKGTLGGLTFFGWAMLLGGVMVGVVCVSVAWWAGAILAPLAGIALNAVFIVRWGDPTSGRTLAAKLWDGHVNAKRGRAGTNTYSTGLFTTLPAESMTALPGMLADLEEITGTDGEGKEYVLLHHRKKSRKPLLSATFSCRPDGTALLPQDSIDAQVSSFGGWIASLSQDTAIEGAVIVVDSAQESIEPLVQKIDNEVSPNAPEAAQRQLREGARALSGTYADVEVFASVVWNVNELADDVEEAAADIAAKLPYHRDGLAEAGAGSPVVATSSDLARAVRVAYRPDRAMEYGSDELAGTPFHMRVTQAGPDEFDDSARRICYHDGVASITAMMVAPPQALITEDLMNRLFQPNGKFLRKRAAVFYGPVDPGKAFKLAKKMRGNAKRNSKGVRGDDNEIEKRREQLAQKTEVDLMTGASMTAFAIEVTVTFEPTKRGTKNAIGELKQIFNGTNISYRFIETDTSAAFHSTLPLGVLPWEYATAMQALTDRSE